jgi:CTP:molybdopterin cytidylyltransferase MocA
VRVAGVVLAAGEGRRFGGPKAVVELAGERLVDRAVRVLRSGGVEDVVVVAGAAPLTVPGARVVDNPDWRSGMGSSLRAGLHAATAYDAVVLLLVDTPGVTPECVRRVGELAAPDALVVATYAGVRGHPVVIGGEHFAGVAAVAARDVGARAYLRGRDDVVMVECGDVGDGRDVDTPADLEHRA